MNTREREVMDALATALRDARDSVAGELALERAAFKGYEGSSNIAQLEAELVAIDSALAAYDALLAEGSAEKCFCDEKYPDSNRAATCGDCPRDYKGSASGEGVEAVAPRYVQWTEAGGVRVDLDSFFKSDAGKAALARFAASAQGEHEQRSCEGSDWNEARFEATYNAVSNTIEGSERRPIADGASIATAIALELARIDGYDPEDENGGLYDLRWSSGASPEPLGDAWAVDYLPKGERIAKALESALPRGLREIVP